VSGETESRSDAQGLGPKTVLVFFVFAGAGPPIGSLIVETGVFLFSPAPPVPHGFRFYLDHLGTAALFSYILGGLQALFVAAVAVIFQVKVRTGFVPFLPILVSSLIACVVVAIVLGRGDLDDIPSYVATLLVVFAFHVTCGILCWLICNGLLWPFRPRPANQVAT
jgi:hypothetical protein